MNELTENVQDAAPSLELGLQELEALEAPFWATAAGWAVTGAGAYAGTYAVLSGAALT